MIPSQDIATQVGQLVKENASGTIHGFMRVLLENGFTVWAVGGIIRDAAMDRRVTDIDLVTDKNPIEIADRFASRHGLGYVILDEARCMARIVMGSGSRFKNVDVSLMRGTTIDDDLRHRDFTINAVAVRFDGARFAIHDPLGGLADMGSKTLRAVSQTSMRDDPVRVLRARRFENSHNLTPSQEIAQMASSAAHLLADVAGERVSQELLYIFREPFSHRAITAMDADGSLDFVFPELSPARSAPQNLWHHLDVFAHSVETLSQMETIIANPPEWMTQWRKTIDESLCEEISGGWTRLEVLKMTALLHDVGKPACAALSEDSKRTFYSHEKAGEGLVTQAANRLRLPGAVRSGLMILVKNHLRPFNALHDGELSERSVYRFHRDLEPWTVPAVIHAVSDAMATQGPAVTGQRRLAEWSAAVKVLDYAQRARMAPQSREPLLDGRDIMEVFSLPEGPLIGRLIVLVKEAHTLGEINTKEEAVAFVKEELARVSDETGN